MNKSQHLEGGCICGQVKYQITDKPLFTQACHCKDCKKSTGSSFVIHSMVLEKEFILEKILKFWLHYILMMLFLQIMVVN